MRGFLIFLMFAFPAVVVSPVFWSLVNMEFGAERVGYVRNGVTQWAWLGPMSPWPNWALVPDGATLTVRAHFEAAPNAIATGYGDVALKDPSANGRAAYASALERAGWTTTVSHFDTVAPELPPHLMHFCIIEAHKGARGLLFSYERESDAGIGSLHWTEGPLPAMKSAVPGSC